MGDYIKKYTGVLLSTILCVSLANAQKIEQVFEQPKDRTPFSGTPELNFNVDLVFYFQGLNHDYKPATGSVNRIEPGLILPTANFDINAKIMSGFNVKLETMLSSHHHNDAYVKGGYATVDNLDFIYDGFLSSFMDRSTIKIGVNDVNYGDDHFRRTDNADVFRNPFIFNHAVDAYMQGTHIEVLTRLPEFNSFVMAGITNGITSPNDISKVDTDGSSNRYALYGKLGFDKQFTEDFRFRITESLYWQEGTNRGDLYAGDKAGDVAEGIFGNKGTAQVTTWSAMKGYSANGKEQTYADILASKLNVFAKYKGTEVYGLFEYADGADYLGADMKMTHYAIDLVQRFYNDKFYVAGRYENAVVKYADFGAAKGTAQNPGDAEVTQYEIAGGWYLSPSAMVKVSYIKQKRENFSNAYYVDNKASFDGFMVSAALTF
ncbi:MAG: hypothetical protein ACK5LP_03460 [Campylobacteraceae bacterium]